jgi:hypothetical protein
MSLYEDDAPAQGELPDRDYWQAKFDTMMLDLALKQRQPEGRIGFNLASVGRAMDDLAKKYPTHEEIKKMQAKVETIQKKIDPNADRFAPWKPGCPWDEANFVQLWVNWHTAKTCMANNDPANALMYMSNVNQNYELLSRPDRLKDYPPELKQWFDDTKPQAEAFTAELKKKLGR